MTVESTLPDCGKVSVMRVVAVVQCWEKRVTFSGMGNRMKASDFEKQRSTRDFWFGQAAGRCLYRSTSVRLARTGCYWRTLGRGLSFSTHLFSHGLIVAIALAAVLICRRSGAGREVAILLFQLQRRDRAGTAQRSEPRTGGTGSRTAGLGSAGARQQLPLVEVELPLGLRELSLLRPRRHRRLRAVDVRAGRVGDAGVVGGREVCWVEAWQRLERERAGGTARSWWRGPQTWLRLLRAGDLDRRERSGAREECWRAVGWHDG